MSALFISDLHLCEERPHTIRLFHRFLADTAPTVRQLYILGDLFEYWAGDDAASTMQRDIADRLNRLSQQGTTVFFIPGNRDFLIGKTFTRRCGWTLLKDECLLRHQGQTLLLMHGDTLCTDDVEYIRFREKSRNPLRRFLFLLLPLKIRLNIIHKYRGMSKTKDLDIMDVNRDTVIRQMQKYNARWLIHGHTHRPDTHVYHMNGKTLTRFVLADWNKEGQALLMNKSGFHTLTVSPA